MSPYQFISMKLTFPFRDDVTATPFDDESHILCKITAFYRSRPSRRIMIGLLNVEFIINSSRRDSSFLIFTDY
jgi:hypothetical protein